jgi:DNA-directed RNA polymerase specialized sigma24 family protein
MSTEKILWREKPGSIILLRDLASAMANGKRYERSASVQAEIRKMLPVAQSEWVAAAADLQSETLVYLIRQIRGGDQQLMGDLLDVLGRRIDRIARRLTGSLDALSREEIAQEVKTQIWELLLVEMPRKTDFLEVSFLASVQCRTINAVEKHNNSAMGRRGEIVVVDDGDDSESSVDLVADGRPGPAEILLRFQREVLLDKACRRVRDPRRLEALVLHVCFDWPVTSKNPETMDLVRHFNATPGQIKHWIKTALKTMRAAIGGDE